MCFSELLCYIITIYRALGYERVYLPRCELADTLFDIQRGDIPQALQRIDETFWYLSILTLYVFLFYMFHNVSAHSGLYFLSDQ